MDKKDFLTGHDRRMYLLAEDYDRRLAEGKAPYLDPEDAADLADYFSRTCQADKAMDLVDYALEMHKGNTELLVQKAYLLLDKGLHAEATEVSDTIAEETDQVIILRAYLLLYADETRTEAEKQFARLSDPQELGNVIDIAYAYADNGWWEEALEYLEAQPPQLKEDNAYKACLADCLLDAARYEQAARAYNELIDQNPYSTTYWYGLARCHYYLEQYDQAIDACDYAIAIDEEMGDAYMFKGHSFAALRNTEQALCNYELATRYGGAPSFYTESYKGLVAMDREDWTTARRHLERVIQEYKIADPPVLASHLYCLAFTLYELGEKRRALDNADTAVELDPFSNTVVLGAARLYALEGYVNHATELWDQAEENVPGIRTWEEIGQTCIDTGHPATACRYFEKIAEAAPGHPAGRVTLPMLAATIGDKALFADYTRRYLPSLGADDWREVYRLMDLMGRGDKKNDLKLAESILHIIEAQKENREDS